MVLLAATLCSPAAGAEFEADIKPLIGKYCVRCHSGDDANGDIDFGAYGSTADVTAHFEAWEAAVENLRAGAMPPGDEPQPTAAERQQILDWFHSVVASIEPRPAPFRPRRLSVHEYRQTLRSVIGFDLEVAIIEAEQTLAERSLVVKLLPTDPPGQSGFTNDTGENPLTTVIWDQYSYLVDTALEELFSANRAGELQELCGVAQGERLNREQAEQLVATVIERAWRRRLAPADIAPYLERLAGLNDEALVAAVKFELKAILMSPRFLYRGLLHEAKSGRSRVDSFELAERLSYFLWADMPDSKLLQAAADGSLQREEVLRSQLDRMLTSPKARNLAEDFAVQWMTLNEIEHASNNPPVMVALKSQPIDFMHYLFTNARPLL